MSSTSSMIASNKKLTIFLYRNLLRKCNHFDKNPKLKAYFVTPDTMRNQLPTFFLPSVSFTDNLKAIYRMYAKHDYPTPLDITTSISDGFMVLKNLNVANIYYKKHIEKESLDFDVGSIIKDIEKQSKLRIDEKSMSPFAKGLRAADIFNNQPLFETDGASSERISVLNPNRSFNLRNLNNKKENQTLNEEEEEEEVEEDEEEEIEEKVEAEEVEEEEEEQQNNNDKIIKNEIVEGELVEGDTKNGELITSNTTTTPTIEALQTTSTTSTTTSTPIQKEKKKIIKKKKKVVDGEKNTNHFWAIDQSREIKPGTLLISHPSLRNVYNRSVVLITHTVNDKHYGYIINQPIPTTPIIRHLQETIDNAAQLNNHTYSKNLVKHFRFTQKRPLSPFSKINWYRGGPYQIEQYSHMVKGINGLSATQIIHPYPEIQGSKIIRDGLYFGGDFKDIGDKIKNKEILPESCMMVMGCSVWRAGDLRKEIDEGAWFQADCTLDQILRFGKDDKYWAEALRSMGGDYSDLVK